MRTYLFFPSIRRGNGTGHLRRCASWAQELGTAAGIVALRAGEPGYFNRDQVERIIETAGVGHPEILYTVPDTPGIFVFDNRETDEALAGDVAGRGPIIALDESGPVRMAADYLIDTLPRVKRSSPANIASVAFLSLPRPSPESQRPGEVLVTFGGEDPAGLTEHMVRALVPSFFTPEAVTVIRPVGKSVSAIPDGIRIIDQVPDLKGILGTFGLVFCSFGLTAFEACAAGASVILFNPSSYHRALSLAADFPEIGVRRPDRRRLAALLSDPEGLKRRCASLVPDKSRSLPLLLAELDTSGSRGCPVCGSMGNPAVGRFPGASFFRCADCGLVYREGFAKREIEYDRSYFFEEYRAQYGKTYLEDFDAIRRVSRSRIEILKAMKPPAAGGRLLDIGCAYGPFLAEARDAGYRACGTDISPEAVGYVNDVLGIPAQAVSFENFDPSGEHFDVITMWYVIEHFSDLDIIMEKVSRMLLSGGIFAFSTPNLDGISGKRDLRAFLAGSPEDHRSIFSPSSARKMLRRYGMTLERIRITGHHPERFPPGPRWAYHAAGRLFGLGDTFEAYAVKNG